MYNNVKIRLNKKINIAFNLYRIKKIIYKYTNVCDSNPQVTAQNMCVPSN